MSWNGRFDAALHRWWDQAPIAAEALDSDPCHFCSDTRPDFVEWAMQSSDFVWTRWMRCSFTRIFLELHAELDWEALDAPWAGTSVRAALRSGREQYVDSRLYQQAQRIARVC